MQSGTATTTMTLPPDPPLQPLVPEPEGTYTVGEEGTLDIEPTFNHMELNIESYIKHTMNFKLDTDAQICRDFLTDECPRGVHCPYRHTQPSARNFRPPSPVPMSAHSRTVCKHWLRGLCKKGAQCEFLHEFNMRKMPECWFYATNGYCQSGEECMYLHNGPRERRPECRAFTKGFCVAGPACPYKHIRRVACPLYITGFCPRGQDCQYVHPPYQAEELSRVLDPEFLKKKREAERGLYSNRDRDWPEEFGGRGSGAVGSGAPGQAHERGPGGGGAGGGPGGGRPKRDLSEILCFKCGNKGHYASMCPNPAVPGARGGVERSAGGKMVVR